jgi:hypothetical protein
MDMKQPSSLNERQAAAIQAAQRGDKSLIVQMELVHQRQHFGEEVSDYADEVLVPFQIIGETVRWTRLTTLCLACKGRGSISPRFRAITDRRTCPTCNGSGSLSTDGEEFVTDMDGNPLDEDES